MVGAVMPADDQGSMLAAADGSIFSSVTGPYGSSRNTWHIFAFLVINVHLSFQLGEFDQNPPRPS
jgi:hypothetical protein